MNSARRVALTAAAVVVTLASIGLRAGRGRPVADRRPGDGGLPVTGGLLVAGAESQSSSRPHDDCRFE